MTEQPTEQERSLLIEKMLFTSDDTLVEFARYKTFSEWIKSLTGVHEVKRRMIDLKIIYWFDTSYRAGIFYFCCGGWGDEFQAEGYTESEVVLNAVYKALKSKNDTSPASL
jgi:hypothetical protein